MLYLPFYYECIVFYIDFSFQILPVAIFRCKRVSFWHRNCFIEPRRQLEDILKCFPANLHYFLRCLWSVRWHIETSLCASPYTVLSVSGFTSIYHSLEVHVHISDKPVPGNTHPYFLPNLTFLPPLLCQVALGLQMKCQYNWKACLMASVRYRREKLISKCSLRIKSIRSGY